MHGISFWKILWATSITGIIMWLILPLAVKWWWVFSWNCISFLVHSRWRGRQRKEQQQHLLQHLPFRRWNGAPAVLWLGWGESRQAQAEMLRASTGLLPTLKPHQFVQDFRKGNQSFSALGPDPSPTEKLPFVENPISSQGLTRIWIKQKCSVVLNSKSAIFTSVLSSGLLDPKCHH